jgi:hypothetical protein
VREDLTVERLSDRNRHERKTLHTSVFERDADASGAVCGPHAWRGGTADDRQLVYRIERDRGCVRIQDGRFNAAYVSATDSGVAEHVCQ